MRIALVIALVSLLSGCGTFTTRTALDQAVAAKQQEIAQITERYDGLLAQVKKQYEDKIQQVLAGKDIQMRAAADAFYGQDALFHGIKDPARTDLVWHNMTTEGWAALGNVMPTYERMQEIQKRLEKDLDEARTSIEDLQREHDAVVTQNAALAAATAQYEKDAAVLKDKITATEHERDTAIIQKQTALTTLQNERIAASDAQAKRDAAMEAQKAKLSWGAGILAALCLAGAIFSPIGKPKLGVLAAILGGAAVAIPMIQPLHVLIVVGLGIIGVIAWMLWGHHKDEKLSDSLVLGLQSVKDNSPEVWAQIKGKIQDALGKYTTKDGKTVVVPDPAMDALVESKLKEYQALPAPVVATPATPTDKN